MRAQRFSEQASSFLDGGRSRLVLEDRPRRAGQRLEAAGADLEAKGGRSDVLEFMGLIEDDQVVGRKQIASGGERGRIEVGVHHDHIGLCGPGAGRLGKTDVARGAASGAGALPRPDAQLGPGHRTGLPGQVGPVSGGGAFRPIHQSANLPAERAEVGRTADGIADIKPHLLVTAGHLGHALPADVVGTALEHREFERRVECGGQVGEIPGGELILEGLGCSRHHRPGSEDQRRDQVGETLARARPGLHHQVPLLGNGAPHRLGHCYLGGTILLLGESCRGAGESGADRRVGHDLQAKCFRSRRR